MEFEFLVDNVLHRISFEKKENSIIFREGDRSFEADISWISPEVLSLLVDGRSHLVYIARDKEKRYIFLEGQQFIVHEPLEEAKGFQKGEEKALEGKLFVTAPMPGKVIKINVEENEEVRKNQTLAIVEAMKMENEIKSSIEGFVKKIFVSPGDLVDSEKPLIELTGRSSK